MRVCVPQAAVSGFDHDGVRYTAKHGVMTVPDHVGRHLIKNDECFPAADIPKAAGRICEACGFHGYFAKCGRCGGACHKPGGNHAHEED